MGWFAVKILFRMRPVGQAQRRDQFYLPGLAAVEERIVLFRAQDGTAALKKAEAEARRYAKRWSKNRYGQRVVTEVLDYLEGYELFGEPGDGAEVFSAIEITRGTEAPAKIIARKRAASDPSAAHMFIAGWIAQDLKRRCAPWPSVPANKALHRTRPKTARR